MAFAALAATLAADRVTAAADGRLEVAAAIIGSACAAAACSLLQSAAAELPLHLPLPYGEKAAWSRAQSVFWGRSPALSTSEAWTDAILMAATRRTHLQMSCVTVSVDAVTSCLSEPHHGSFEQLVIEFSNSSGGSVGRDRRVCG